MEFITSRRFILPLSADEMAERSWFNLWHRKLWPYQELVIGDTLYWYESPSKNIVWKSKVVDVDRYSYDRKKIVREKLESRFGAFDINQPYFLGAPEQGYCLAWKVMPLERMSLPKPEQLRFPQQGWLHITDEIAETWLLQPEPSDDTILDELASDGSLHERIAKLNAAMAEVSFERVRSVVSRTIRCDTRMIQALKELCEFRCQFPDCGVRIPKQAGGFYIEVAHIQPVREGGQSILGNLLVLCPNHHKEFDYGETEIIEQTATMICGKLNDREFEIRLPMPDTTA